MIRALLATRYVTFTAVAVLLVVLACWGRRVSYEQSISSFFAEDDPYMRVYQQAARTFGDDNFVFLVYDDPALLTPAGLDRVSELAATVAPGRIEGVQRVESLDAMPLLWAVDDALLALDRLPVFARNLALSTAKRTIKNIDLKTNAMTVSGVVRASSADPAALAALRKRLTRHPLFLGTLIDARGTTTAVVARLRKTNQHNVIATVAALRDAADAFAARHRLGRPAVVGPPVLLADGFSAIEVDGRRLAVIGMILIGVVTLSAVRSVWWAIVPMLAGWVIWLATEEVLAGSGIKLALSGGPLVAQIIVLTMPAASHLAIHFREDRRREADPRRAARATLGSVAAPIAWTAITGAIGYGALVTSDVMPVRQFGTILGTCTLGAAILVMLISPIAMLPPFRMEIPVRYGSRSRVAAAMNRLIHWVHLRPAVIVAAVAVVVLPLALGLVRLHYETNYINLFRPETRVVGDYHAVESRLGGIGLVELIVPVGPSLTPEVLSELKGIEERIRAIRVSDPAAIAQVLSLATVLDPDGRLASLPDDRQGRLLAEKLELIAASPQSELLRGFWNPEAGATRFLIRLKEQQPAPDKTRIFRLSAAAAAEVFGPSSYLTGLSFLMTRTTEAIVATQWGTFLWSALGILLMLTLAFGSLVLAVLAILPTLLAVALVLGLMGWLGIQLDMATALVASVALGLSVDDTFHCLLQFHRHRQTRGFRRRLFESYRVSGPGVILSSLAVAIGFAALRASEFEPFVNFGTMVGIATAGSTLGNLVLLPACLTLGRRWRRSRKQPQISSVPARA
ncbi:MAG TPA: MMPL family transporter [Isosphaeraceae bacterium]|nr:MMPL family transporter [Isosphaeraceae bacterium]